MDNMSSRFKDVECINVDDLKESFKTLGKFVSVTTGHYEIPAQCDMRDLDWNHMDQRHRNYVHGLYEETLRVGRGANFALSLTNIRVLGVPFLVLITDVRLDRGLFYQTFNLFNLIYVHVVIKSLSQPKEDGKPCALRTVDWYIVSHSIFKFLHPSVARRLERINEVQNKEDLPLQERRVRLRKNGYRFLTDDPNYINTNDLKPHLIMPKLVKSYEIPLSDCESGQLKKVSAGPVELLVRKDGETEITVWPAHCPHEGGPLEDGKFCSLDTIRCPWHGLKFAGAHLSLNQNRVRLEGLELSIAENILTVKDGVD